MGVSRKSRRLSPASRDERRAGAAAKRAGETWVWPDSVFPESGYQLGVGSYANAETDKPTRPVEKHPFGFTKPEDVKGAG